MRRRGLRNAELDKKVWEWSLTEKFVTKNKIQNYARNLFTEAGIGGFKASDCWYRRWKSRWKNQPDAATSNCTEIKNFPTQNKMEETSSSKKKRKNSKNINGDLNIGKSSKKSNLVTVDGDRTSENFEVLCETNSSCYKNTKDNETDAIRIAGSTRKEMVISDRITKMKSTKVCDGDGIFSGLEFSDISAQTTRIHSENCSDVAMTDCTSSTVQIDGAVKSGVLENGRISEALTQTGEICGKSGSYSIKKAVSCVKSTSQQLENKIDERTTLMNEIDCSLGRIGDGNSLKSQPTTSSCSQINFNILDLDVSNCELAKGRVGECLEANLNDSQIKNIVSCAINNNSEVENSVQSSENIQVSSICQGNTTQSVSNFESFENATCRVQTLENFVEISNDSVFPNFLMANLDETTDISSGCDKIVTELKSVQNFVEVSNNSVFKNFTMEEVGDRSKEIVTELRSVGLDFSGKDQQNLEVRKVVSSNLNFHSESSVSDNFDSCLMSAEFQIPGLSLGSDELFESYRNCLFMESNYLFCESCDDFHINEVDDCVGDLNDEIVSLKGPEIDSQPKNKEQESVCKDQGPFNKCKDGCSSVVQETEGQREKRKGERYLPKFKRKVVAYAKSHTSRETALKFNVFEGTVSEWVQAKYRRSKTQDFGPYKEPTSTPFNVEEQFITWLKAMRENQTALNQRIIGEKLENLLKPEENLEKRVESWLEHYLERLKNEENPAEGTSESDKVVKNKKSAKKYLTYSSSFKKEVALYAEKFSQKAASRNFLVARKRVYEWMEAFKVSQGQGQQSDDKQQDGTAKLEKRDRSSYVVVADIDRNILDWYKGQRVPPTAKQVREMGRKLYADEGYDVKCSDGWWRRWKTRHQIGDVKSMTSLDNHILEWVLGRLDSNAKVSFTDLIDYVSNIGAKNGGKTSKVSSGWVFRFCKRYPVLLQRTPKFDTNLPPALELKVILFRKRIQKLIDEFKITENGIGTIDEIPIRFTDADFPGLKTKEQLIRKSGFDNCQASLVVSCLASGKLLPTVVIFKGGFLQDSVLKNKDVFGFINESGCLDSQILHFWINNIWSKSQTQKTPSILVSNQFQPYKDSTVVSRLSSMSCKHEIFPAGCLSKLQPIRVALSKAFQDGVNDFWKSTSSEDEMFKMNYKLSRFRPILEWTTEIHNKIATTYQEDIKSSFKKTLLAKDEKELVQGEVVQNIVEQPNQKS